MPVSTAPQQTFVWRVYCKNKSCWRRWWNGFSLCETVSYCSCSRIVRCLFHMVWFSPFACYRSWCLQCSEGGDRVPWFDSLAEYCHATQYCFFLGIRSIQKVCFLVDVSAYSRCPYNFIVWIVFPPDSRNTCTNLQVQPRGLFYG